MCTEEKKKPSLFSLLALPYYTFYKKKIIIIIIIIFKILFIYLFCQPSKFLPIFTFCIDLYSKIRFCF